MPDRLELSAYASLTAYGMRQPDLVVTAKAPHLAVKEAGRLIVGAPWDPEWQDGVHYPAVQCHAVTEAGDRRLLWTLMGRPEP